MQAEAAEKIAGLIHGPRPDEDRADDETHSPPDRSDDDQDPRRS
jgi:hypothetical protein